MTNRVTIRTTEDARTYLAGRDLLDGLNVVNDAVVESAACTRCGGSGNGGWYPDGGICYECRGANTMNRTRTTGLMVYARAERRREMAAARKGRAREAARERSLEGQRNWCEANGYGRVTFLERDEARATARDEASAARKAERETNSTSEYVGEEGQRLTFDATLERVGSFERRAYSYPYGDETCFIYTFRDSDGNALVTFTTRDLGLDTGDAVAVRGTVKGYESYEGEKQTTLTRVNVKRAAVKEAA